MQAARCQAWPVGTTCRSVEIGDELFDIDRFGFTHRANDGVGDVFFNDAVPFGKALVRRALVERRSDRLTPSLQISRQSGLNEAFSDDVGFAHWEFSGGFEASILTITND